jgi:hypothetical protein
MEVTMKKLLIGLSVLPLLAGAATAQPKPLTDAQMDGVTAGVTSTDAAGLLSAIDNLRFDLHYIHWPVPIPLPPGVCSTCPFPTQPQGLPTPGF